MRFAGGALAGGAAAAFLQNRPSGGLPATADVQAQATSHRLCPHGPAAELISAAPDNQVIDRVISDDRDSRVVIDRVTSAALANLAIVQPTLVDLDNQAIDQVTSANRDDPATSADRATR